jgi:hypothetical protein
MFENLLIKISDKYPEKVNHLAFWSITIDQKTLEQSIIKATCTDQVLNGLLYFAINNHTLNPSNVSFSCNNFTWNWNAQDTSISVVDVATTNRRLQYTANCNPNKIPFDDCFKDTYWTAGFVGFYTTDAAGTADSANAISLGSLDIDETISEYQTQVTSLFTASLPILWFFGWLFMRKWDFNDKEFFNAKVNRGPEYGSELFPPMKPSPIMHTVFGINTNILASTNNIQHFIHIIAREHPALNMFSFSSQRLPRNIRYLAFWSHVLIVMFLSCMLSSVVLVTMNDCNNIADSDQCMQATSQLLNTHVCTWDANKNHCGYRDYEPNFLSTMVCTSVIMFIAHIIHGFFQYYFWYDIASREPRLNEIKYLHSFLENNDEKYNEVLNHIDKVVDTYEEIDIVNENAPVTIMYQDPETLYNSSVETEVKYLIKNVIDYLHTSINNDSCQAVCSLLNLERDGSPRIQSLIKRLFLGSPTDELTDIIYKACDESAHICNELSSFDYTDNDCRDVMLMQYFIMSHFDGIQQHIVRKELHQFDNLYPGTVDPYVWASFWAVIVTSHIVMVLFVGIVLLIDKLPVFFTTLWLSITGWSILQHHCMIVPFQLFIMHILSIKNIRSRLRQIYNVLQTSINNDQSDDKPDDLGVSKHICAPCRVSHMISDGSFAAVSILRKLRDRQIMQCRQEIRAETVPWFSTITMYIPNICYHYDKSLGTITFNMITSLQWNIAWSSLYLIHSINHYFGPTIIASVILYISYVYLARKPYYKMRRDRGVTPGWEKRAYTTANGKRIISYFKREPEQAQYSIWRNMNRPSMLQPIVSGQYWDEYSGSNTDIPKNIRELQYNSFNNNAIAMWNIKYFDLFKNKQLELKYLHGCVEYNIANTIPKYISSTDEYSRADEYIETDEYSRADEYSETDKYSSTYDYSELTIDHPENSYTDYSYTDYSYTDYSYTDYSSSSDTTNNYVYASDTSTAFSNIPMRIYSTSTKRAVDAESIAYSDFDSDDTTTTTTNSSAFYTVKTT